MSDTPPERNSNSKSNLIEVQHVGVTAKLQSPLINLMHSSSSEAENVNQLPHDNKTKYNKFTNDTQVEESEDPTGTDVSKILYEMRSINPSTRSRIGKGTPSKIEFQLYQRPGKRLRRNKTNNLGDASKYRRKTSKRKLFNIAGDTRDCDGGANNENTLFHRLRQSLDGMRQAQPNIDQIIDGLPEPITAQNCMTATTRAMPARDTRIGIYPFEHGCADYLRTTDCHPQLVSVVLAERATNYATRFWAEFFGSLHIGVAFVVTFMLQCYRFVLYSVINTLLVGILHMTSDYLLKPVLTVLFNGFLQPPMIFAYNILSSLRDIVEPVADTINNFMKPIATVGKSIRLIHATYNNRKLVKDV